MNMTIEEIDPNKLTPHPKNYKYHPDDQLEHLKKSIDEYGFYRNVVIANDDVVLAGHGMVEAAVKYDLKKIPVHRVDVSSTDQQALKLLIGDNEIALLSDSDNKTLADLLNDIREDDDLFGTGYDDSMVNVLSMISRESDELEKFDANAEWNDMGMPEWAYSPPPSELVFHFKTNEERDDFLKAIDVTNKIIKDDSISARWPDNGKDDLKNVRFE